MGVKGLWELIQPVGRPVNLDSLQGKVLAIDVSLWLHQAVHGFRDAHGNSLPNAHVLGLFHRLCKLLHYRIKPVFVFDGGIPALKKQTLAARRHKQSVASKKSAKASEKLLKNIMKSHAVKHVLGETSTDSSDCIKTSKKNPDLFELPPVPDLQQDNTVHEDAAFDVHADDLESQFENIEQVDIESDDFKKLPPEIQHEILSDLKAVRYQHSWTKMDEMPEESNNFSKFQLSKVLRQSHLSQKISDVVGAMNARASGEAVKTLGVQGAEVVASRILSDETSHFILVKGLQAQSTNLTSGDTVNDDKEETHDVIKCDEDDLERAIVLSCQSSNDYIETNSEDNKNASHKQSIQNIDSTPNGTTYQSTSETTKQIDDTRTSCIDLTEIDTSNEKEKHQTAVPDRSIVGGHISESENDGENLQHDSSTNQSHVAIKPTNLPPQVIDNTPTVIEPLSASSTLNTKSTIQNAPPTIEEIYIEHVDVAKDLISIEDNEQSTDGSDDEDEGFIEVTVNPNAPPDDDLFPASIFETNAELPPIQRHDSEEPVTHKDIHGESMDSSIDIKDAVDESEIGADTKDMVALSKEELQEFELDIRIENENIRQEIGRQERIANTLNDQMYVEAQELLRLFGIPYIVSPMEAEAQCAELDKSGQVDGVITDDSDIWLFGAKRVYKNFISNNRDVEYYTYEDLLNQMGLNREKMVCIALVCGSDYTDGIHKAGAVTALEILAEFGGKDFESLQQFKFWNEQSREKKIPRESKIKGQLRHLDITEGFPSQTVINAYIEPTVDTSSDELTWGMPDLDLLREFAMEKFGWTLDKVDGLLLPMMKMMNKHESQLTIDRYLSTDPKHVLDKNVKSKRLKRVFTKFLNKPEESDEITNDKRKKEAVKFLGSRQIKTRKGNKKGPANTSSEVKVQTLRREVDLSESSSEEMDDETLMKCAIEAEKSLISNVKKKGKGKGSKKK